MPKIYRAVLPVPIEEVVRVADPLNQGGAIEAVVDPAQSAPTYEFKSVTAQKCQCLIQPDWTVHAFTISSSEDFLKPECRLPAVIEALDGVGRLFARCSLTGPWKSPIEVRLGSDLDEADFQFSIFSDFDKNRYRDVVVSLFQSVGSTFHLATSVHHDRCTLSGHPDCLLTDDPIYHYTTKIPLNVPRSELYPIYASVLRGVKDTSQRFYWFSTMIIPDKDQMEPFQAMNRTFAAAADISLDLSIQVGLPNWRALDSVRQMMSAGQIFEHPVASFHPSKDGKGYLGVRIEPEGFRWELVWTKDISEAKMQEIRDLTGIPPLVPFVKPPAKRRKPWSRKRR